MRHLVYYAVAVVGCGDYRRRHDEGNSSNRKPEQLTSRKLLEYGSGGVANAVSLFVGLLSLILGGCEGSLPLVLVI